MGILNVTMPNEKNTNTTAYLTGGFLALNTALAFKNDWREWISNNLEWCLKALNSEFGKTAAGNIVSGIVLIGLTATTVDYVKTYRTERKERAKDLDQMTESTYDIAISLKLKHLALKKAPDDASLTEQFLRDGMRFQLLITKLEDATNSNRNLSVQFATDNNNEMNMSGKEYRLKIDNVCVPLATKGKLMSYALKRQANESAPVIIKKLFSTAPHSLEL